MLSGEYSNKHKENTIAPCTELTKVYQKVEMASSWPEKVDFQK